MLCPKCQNSNRKDSQFCRFCGSQILRDAKPELSTVSRSEGGINITIPGFRKIVGAIRDLHAKALVVIFIVLVFSGVTVFAAPLADNYLDVNGAIKNAENLSESGNFQGALDVLNSTNDLWSTRDQREQVASLRERQEQYLKDAALYADAIAKKEAKDYKGAREALQSISADYPKSTEVAALLSDVQGLIEGDLEAKATAANAARAAAERRAQAEAAAKVQAEADARASAEARARADQAARDAESRRQEEEAERIRQVKISFLNQLQSIRGSYSTAVGYYNGAMDSYNNPHDSYAVALAMFGQAEAAARSAYNAASGLNSNFQNMPSDFVTAANNMRSAANYLLKASDDMMELCANLGVGGSNANSYTDRADEYRRMVDSFMASQGY